MLCHRLRRGQALYNLSYRTVVQAAANNLTIPNDVEDSDLLVFINFRSVTTSTVSNVTPAGFTAIGTAANGGGTHRISASMKIGSISDQGQTVTGMSSGSGTVVNQSILLVLRGNRRISSLTSGINGAGFGEIVNTAQSGGLTIPASAGAAPLCAMVFYRQDSATSQTFSVTADNTITQATLTARLKFYNQSPVNISGAQGDGGDNNCLAGCWIGAS